MGFRQLDTHNGVGDGSTHPLPQFILEILAWLVKTFPAVAIQWETVLLATDTAMRGGTVSTAGEGYHFLLH